MKLPIFGTVLALAASASCLYGQTRSVGDMTTDGRIYTQVYITILEPGQYGHPINNVSLIVVDAQGKRYTLKTDDAGGASTLLEPGSYRLATTAAARWDSAAFSWDLPVTVKAGMHAIELTQQNASSIKIVRATSTSGPAAAGAPTNPPITGDRKDPTMATLLSFLIPGVGEMYAGAPGKGVGFLIAGIAGSAMLVAGLNCNTRLDCSGGTCDFYTCTNGSNGNDLIIAGAALSVTTWVVSMIDAHQTANTYNAEHGFVATLKNITPMVARGPSRTTRVGLQVSLAR